MNEPIEDVMGRALDRATERMKDDQRTIAVLGFKIGRLLEAVGTLQSLVANACPHVRIAYEVAGSDEAKAWARRAQEATDEVTELLRHVRAQ